MELEFFKSYLSNFNFTADPFDKVQCEVAKIIDGRILVGHALDNDLLVNFFKFFFHYKKI